ncbi:N-acetylmuramoyl-L-alanine amidase [Paenibacillus oenotherae]|uniref:N-acetylmuramoyl-L-alanine amidase n=1 Tax=Paenibacillus oenotherae TaxID=1435645 RepID=A0ABS7D2Q6_9BACL|nr:N-acetylmuramoyl-L-alanine amidase [Paenibacillus oenotherae]MBW7474086.1 N-acetylmuramoyl-L-alanine amidase [Paenibacillus oenotherae]
MIKQNNFILFDSREEFRLWLFQQKVARPIYKIQNHHTWIPNYAHCNGKNHFERLEAMRNSHMRDRKFSDIAQQLTTFPDGRIAYSLGRPFDIAPAGIKGANANGICIEHIGNFDYHGDEMSAQHRQTILFINAVLCQRFNLPVHTEHIVYHHWYSASGDTVYDLNSGKRLKGIPAKSCPGTNFFGGNTVSDAQKNFIPHVKVVLAGTAEPDIPIPKRSEEVTNDMVGLTQWQQEMGEQAVRSLAEDGLLQNPKEWQSRLHENIPGWLFFSMLERISTMNKPSK